MVRSYSGGPLVDAFSQMGFERQSNYNRQTKAEYGELLFEGQIRPMMHLNAMMASTIKAFDRDGDKKLNVKEFQAMLKELGFPNKKEANEIFMCVCVNHGLAPASIAVLDSPTFEKDFDRHCKDIVFGVKQIMETMLYCEYYKSLDEDNEDEDFMDDFDLDDEASMIFAIRLLIKFYGHVEAILKFPEPRADDVNEAIVDAVPDFDTNIASIIYDFYSEFKGHHIIKISWHKIKWMDYPEDHEDLWKIYDRNNPLHYDLFYISVQMPNGHAITEINIRICHDTKKCDQKLKKLHKGNPSDWQRIKRNESQHPKPVYVLGNCLPYIPKWSFSIEEHAILIGEVLELHDLDPSFCHYIYVGREINIEYEDKAEVVDSFNEIFEANAKFRPHERKRSHFFDPDANMFW